MFVGNLVCDVYRQEVQEDENDPNQADDLGVLVATKVSVHLTPFSPRYRQGNSDRTDQSTIHLASVRKIRGFFPQQGDRFVSNNNRTFVVGSVEPTGGAFIDNDYVVKMTEFSGPGGLNVDIR